MMVVNFNLIVLQVDFLLKYYLLKGKGEGVVVMTVCTKLLDSAIYSI